MRPLRLTAALLVAALLVAALLAAGCGEDEPRRAGAAVVASTSHAGDFARQVGGERADVRVLLPAGADPHDYEPRPSDARAIAAANLVVRSGADIDAWLGDLLDSAGRGASTIDLIDAVEPLQPDAGDEHEADPHWWQDPRNVERAVVALRDRLARIDPGGRRDYQRNAAIYVSRLRRLDRQIAACIRRVPAGKRKLVTTHDAFGYFARRYGVEVVGALIPSLSSNAQPSAGDIQRLIDQIRREGVEAIFPESALDPRLERAVSRDSGARIGGRLWADSLGRPGTPAATYIGAMSENVQALAEGMSGGRVTCRPRA